MRERKWFIKVLKVFSIMLLILVGELFGIKTEHKVYAASEVEINETNFPDSQFREYVKGNFDKNKDNRLSEDEIEYIEEIYMDSNKIIYDLTGIRNFKNLKILSITNNRIEKLDLSGLVSLEQVSCGSNYLTNIKLSGCINLKRLYCGYNSLKSLDISECTSLQILDCSNNKFSTLNLRGLTQLQILECNNNKITSLSLGNQKQLLTLNCSNNNIASLDLTGLSSLKKVNCSSNVITNLAIYGLSNLETVVCDTNRMKSLNLSGLSALTELNVYNNQLISLNTSYLIKIKQLNCAVNKISSIDLSKLSNLEKLIISGNEINKLDLTQLTKLVSLECTNSNLTTLDVSKNIYLEELYCSYNNLTSLDLTKLKYLNNLFCTNNNLVSINVSSSCKLKNYNFSNNKLSVSTNKVDLSMYSVNTNNISDLKGGTLMGTVMTIGVDGTATFNYKIGSGSKKLKVTITNTALNISKSSTSKIESVTYNGHSIKPAFTVKYNGYTLKKGAHYTISYKNNINTGKATAIITGKGNYYGTKKISFYILPKTVSISTVKSSQTKTAVITWKKTTGSSGYEVVYSTKKLGKYVSAGTTKKTVFTVKNLKKNTTYYVKIRAYKLIDGKKVYGTYSKEKAVKVI